MSFRSHRLSSPLHLRLVLAVLFAALATAAGADESSVSGTLPEDYVPGLKPLIDGALRQSPEMVTSELSIEVADAQRIISGVAPMLPSAGASANYGTIGSSTTAYSSTNTTNTGLSYSASLNQSLFQWGALKNQLEIEKVAELIAQKNYAEGYIAFVGSVRKQYLALIIDKITLRNAQFHLKLSQNTLAVATEKLKTGSISPSETITPQMQADQDQLDADRAEQAYAFARHALAREVGLKDIPEESIPLEIAQPKDTAPAASTLLAELMRDRAANTFEAQVAALNIRSADLSYKIAKVRLLPKFSLSASISQQNQTYAAGPTVYQEFINQRQYGVSGSWTLFDGMATSAAKRQALLNKRIYENQLEKLTDDIMDQAQTAERNLRFAWRLLALTQRQYDLTANSLRLVKDDFKRGNVAQDSVDNSTYSLYTNDYLVAARRIDFLTAWSDFLSRVGADPVTNNLPARYVRDTR